VASIPCTAGALVAEAQQADAPKPANVPPQSMLEAPR
jgi:hypothetical protein